MPPTRSSQLLPDATTPPHAEGRASGPDPARTTRDDSTHKVEPSTTPRLSALLPRPGRIAVLGQGVAWWGGSTAVEWAPRDVAELGAWAESRGVAQVWVHASALESLGLPREIHVRDRRAAPSHPFTDSAGDFTSSRAGLAAWSYWYRKGGAGFDLHVPAYGGRDHPWRSIDSAAELLCQVVAFDDATRGVRWCGSAAITSDVFLRRRLRDRLAPTQCPPPITERTTPSLELALVWHRRPADDERGFRWCHALDLNLAYASAASSVELPTGPVEHRDYFPGVDRRRPGLYLFEPGPWRELCPPPWVRPAFEEEGALWVTAPTAERMAQLGLEPLESWTWPAHGRHLRPWYEMLRDARAELLEAGGPALDAVKQVCRWGVGRLAADEGRTLPRGAEYLEDDPTFQPYWAWAVIAETRCRLQRRLQALDVVPVAVDTDCVYFLSSRPDPETLGRRLGLPIGDELGRFKTHGSCRARDALDVLDTPDTPGAVSALRKLVRDGT